MEEIHLDPLSVQDIEMLKDPLVSALARLRSAVVKLQMKKQGKACLGDRHRAECNIYNALKEAEEAIIVTKLSGESLKEAKAEIAGLRQHYPRYA